MTNEDVAKLLTIAYTLHRANASVNDLEPMRREEFITNYKNDVTEFVRRIEQ